MSLIYPPTKTISHTDDYHGTPVADPYRWLEDLDSPETQAWIAAQNKLTNAYLAQIPQREKIRARLTELWDFPRVTAPFQRGGKYFQFRNTGLQNQDVLFTMPALDAAPRVLLDPNTLSNDGTVALVNFSLSKDGGYLAYSTTTSGSDWLTWRVVNVETGKLLDDILEWSKFSNAAWLPDASGFFYNRYDAPREGNLLANTNFDQKIYFHRVGTSQTQDDLVYERPDQPQWLYSTEVSDDGRYLILSIRESTAPRNRIYYKDLRAGGAFIALIDNFDAGYNFIENDDTLFYFHTNRVPRGEIVALHIATGEARTLIAESGDALEQVVMVNNQFVALYLHDAQSQLKLFARDGAPRGIVALPGLGSLVGVTPMQMPLAFAGNRDDAEMFYAFQSFIQPPAPYRYDFARGESAQLAAPNIAFDAARYETRQVFATSKDGTRVPMFLIHRKNLRADGNHPTFLYGYGGFNIPLVPSFMVMRLVWLEMGGVLAIANLRGGGEYGEEWHAAGTCSRKQNVFDDFFACAEWLIENKITRREKIAVHGRSNGGLLVGACMTQRPDLFGAAVPAVGVMDMLRFHKFTIGWAWASDYGSPDDAEQFPALRAYSPYHNVKPGTRYPATLVTTADHDDRVFPAHSFKFAAALQAAQASDAPALIRIETKAGHGFGRPTKFLIDEATDIWSFIAHALAVNGNL